MEVIITNPDYIEAVRSGIEAADTDKLICSECLSLAQNKETVDRLVRGTKVIQQAGWLLSIFFGIIAIINVLNIIRLTISARSDEIEIMRFVGASNAFTRGPFIIEGILYGVVGTIITSILLPALVLASLGTAAGQGVSNMFSVLGTDALSYIIARLPILIGLQLLLGVGVGVLVSLVSIRRFLRA